MCSQAEENAKENPPVPETNPTTQTDAPSISREIVQLPTECSASCEVVGQVSDANNLGQSPTNNANSPNRYRLRDRNKNQTPKYRLPAAKRNELNECVAQMRSQKQPVPYWAHLLGISGKNVRKREQLLEHQAKQAQVVVAAAAAAPNPPAPEPPIISVVVPDFTSDDTIGYADSVFFENNAETRTKTGNSTEVIIPLTVCEMNRLVKSSLFADLRQLADFSITFLVAQQRQLFTWQCVLRGRSDKVAEVQEAIASTVIKSVWHYLRTIIGSAQTDARKLELIKEVCEVKGKEPDGDSWCELGAQMEQEDVTMMEIDDEPPIVSAGPSSAGEMSAHVRDIIAKGQAIIAQVIAPIVHVQETTAQQIAPTAHVVEQALPSAAPLNVPEQPLLNAPIAPLKANKPFKDLPKYLRNQFIELFSLSNGRRTAEQTYKCIQSCEGKLINNGNKKMNKVAFSLRNYYVTLNKILIVGLGMGEGAKCLNIIKTNLNNLKDTEEVRYAVNYIFRNTTKFPNYPWYIQRLPDTYFFYCPMLYGRYDSSYDQIKQVKRETNRVCRRGLHKEIANVEMAFVRHVLNNEPFQKFLLSSQALLQKIKTLLEQESVKPK